MQDRNYLTDHLLVRRKRHIIKLNSQDEKYKLLLFLNKQSLQPSTQGASRIYRSTNISGIRSKRRPRCNNGQSIGTNSRSAERQRDDRGYERSAAGNQAAQERKGRVSGPEPDARSFCIRRARFGRPEDDQCDAAKDPRGIDRLDRCGKRQLVSAR